jgi:hypothetical protein
MKSRHKNLYWTRHALNKMRYYRLSQSRVKRVLRAPARIEEGIVPKTIAYMQPAGTKSKPSEIWAMVLSEARQLKVITAWRYPGKSPIRNPIPFTILEEITKILREKDE